MPLCASGFFSFVELMVDMTSQPRARNWTFTLNNYQNDTPLRYDPDLMKYLIMGRETAPDTGTPHLQGYVQMTKLLRLTQMKKVHPRAHWEIARGTPVQNRTYCIKDGDYEEFGSMITTGTKNKKRYEELRDQILEGATMADLHTQMRSITEFQFCEKMISYTLKPRTEKPHVYYVYGPTGMGKTRWATSLDPESYYILNNFNNWSGYTQQHVLIIDDYDPLRIPFRDMLQLIDRYQYIANVKYSQVHVNSPIIVITADRHYQDFLWDHSMVSQFARRIDELKHFDSYQFAIQDALLVK